MANRHIIDAEIDNILNNDFAYDKSFSNFTNELSHRLKRLGEVEFINTILRDDDINMDDLPLRQKLYLVAMLDYLCQRNKLPLLDELRPYRDMKMDHLYFAEGVVLFTKTTRNEDLAIRSYNNALAEFLKYNLVVDDIGGAV